MGRILRVLISMIHLKKCSIHLCKTQRWKRNNFVTSQYAKYKPKRGDEFDFRDFNSMLNKPRVIKKNFKLLQQMLKNPNKKVTILTARALGFPIRKFFKDEYGLDVYPVTLASNNPKDKADWIEKHIQKVTLISRFMDDSLKNVRAVQQLQRKYPDVRIKSVLALNIYHRVKRRN